MVSLSVPVTVYERVNTGSKAHRDETSLTLLRTVLGAFRPVSFSEYTKTYGEEGWKQGGTFVLLAVDALKVGNVLEVAGKKYKVIGVMPGRIRHTYTVVQDG